MRSDEVYDLRTALSFLNHKGHAIEVMDKEMDTCCEIPNHYAYYGSGIPNKHQPAYGHPVIYNRVKGHSMPVLIGLLNSREACAELLGVGPHSIGRELAGMIHDRYEPELIDSPPSQENIITQNINLYQQLPVLTYTPESAGPYITTGLVYAQDPETGEEDVTIHRLCLQSEDTMSIYFVPGRHIGHFYEKAKKRNKPLPVTINIGLDPAIYIAAGFSYPACPLGFNELNIAGAIRKKGVKVARAFSNGAKCIAFSEIVIEGFVLPEEVQENPRKHDGDSLPEFLGYIGAAQSKLPLVKVTAITYRNRPIYQTIVGPGAEMSNLCGIPTEASLYKSIKESITGNILNCYCSASGGGKLLAHLQFSKSEPRDDAKTRQAGVAAFTAFHELKNVFLLDDDVDIFDEREVLWALSTRFQGNHSIISIPNLDGHPLDPSQRPEFSSYNTEIGSTYKTVFDCTVPYRMKEHFRRADYAFK
ncbi:UbiD family decarboxylase [Paenibacillus tianjinensis]|uniref:UbiD family decarboxylase n=1 Tax=Paenibacillus tianjinensis TaxID=2810347 RepID=A0ABX7LEI8_9BACL|nr:UbiD family decarboxylase [Paenibacillus tianjinensis]QSF44387.1 UbiD family decarboxylase [Paenibacillus tianjinensis]